MSLCVYLPLTSVQAVRDGLGAELKLKEGKRKLKLGFVFASDCRASVVYKGKFSWHPVSLLFSSFSCTY